MSALRGSAVDIARFMVALAPNFPVYRQQLDAALAAAAGPLRQASRPLEHQRAPTQRTLL